jgi:hypothetical protein
MESQAKIAVLVAGWSHLNLKFSLVEREAAAAVVVKVGLIINQMKTKYMMIGAYLLT